MKSRACVLVLSMVVPLLMGCEGGWTTGGGVDSWSDAYNWVSFAGVYRGIDGGVLVTDYSATPGTPGVTNSVTDERIATCDGSKTKFSGVLEDSPVVRGSLSITVSGIIVLTDNGDGSLSGTGATGTIEYGTGAWAIDLQGLAPDNGTAVRASYLYSVSGSEGSGSSGSGASGKKIYSFTVQQSGENLTIVDNNGSTYSGQFSGISSSGGANQDNQSTPSVGDSVVGEFKASGTSAAGYSVDMVGTFQGVVAAGSGVNKFYLSSRQIFGTWIEDGGRTGDINGEASPIEFTVTTTTTTP